MEYNILELKNDGYYLRKTRGFLSVNSGKDEYGRIALDDLQAVVVSAFSATVSKQLLVSLAKHRIPLIICGDNYLPISICLPYAEHYKFKAVADSQINASKSLKKRLWQIIVRHKVGNQGKALKTLNKICQGETLIRMASRVQSGDKTNIEALAAKFYWKHFNDHKFKRDANGQDHINIMLNYVYTVLRCACARAVVSAGLMPSFGLAHSNQYNPFCLVDDLMEPFRPIADRLVASLLSQESYEMNPSVKRALAEVNNKTVLLNGKRTIVSKALQHLAFSVSKSFESKKPCLDLCEI